MGKFIGRFCRILPSLLLTAQLAFGQVNSDPKESEARGAALQMIESAAEHFECELEEHSISEMGSGDHTRYLFRLSAVGNECDDALLYLMNLAARNDRIIFRAIEKLSPPTRDLVIPRNQDLIHEVDPK